MLLAIPFQGVAAAGMLVCSHAAPQHASAPADHCHDSATPAAQHDAATDHDERCSACAACCIGATMAGAPMIPAAPQTLSARLIPADTGRLVAVDLALPERPPRFPLA